MAMNLISYIILLTLFLNSCSNLDSRAPASSIISNCQSAIISFINQASNKYKPLRIPKNTPTYSMRLTYRGEELSSTRPVKYLNVEERSHYEVFINKDGLVVDRTGAPLTSPIGKLKPLEAVYVVSPEGKIYVSYLTPNDSFQHSSFLSGEDVISAGIITFDKGTIQTFSNESGHYQPTVESIDLMITLLEERKVKIMNVFIAE